MLADPKPQNIALFAGVTCVAPNVAEAATIAGVPIVDDASLERAGLRLLEMLDCRYVVITRGEHGMALFGRDGERLQIPSVARTVYDVSGAGDTVIAVLALALAAGAPIEQAMQLANFAAGAVVEKLGTATASPRGDPRAGRSRDVTASDVLRPAPRASTKPSRGAKRCAPQGRTVVFTNGCFDVLHAGHVEYLAWARAQGDALIVGLNEDESVRRIKGDAPSDRRRSRSARAVLLRVAQRRRRRRIRRTHARDRCSIAFAPTCTSRAISTAKKNCPSEPSCCSHGGRIALAPHVAGMSTTDTDRSHPRCV